MVSASGRQKNRPSSSFCLLAQSLASDPAVPNPTDEPLFPQSFFIRQVSQDGDLATSPHSAILAPNKAVPPTSPKSTVPVGYLDYSTKARLGLKGHCKAYELGRQVILRREGSLDGCSNMKRTT